MHAALLLPVYSDIRPAGIATAGDHRPGGWFKGASGSQATG